MPKKLLLCLLLCLCLVPAVVQAKSQWITADTKYLSLIFREQDQAAAAELAVFADDVVNKVAEYFSASLNEKIQVLLLGELDVANGMAVSIPRHIVIYLRAPQGFWLGARGESWLKLVFIHELTHYFDMKSETGLFYNLSFMFGPAWQSFHVGFTPVWLLEGLAVLFETEFSQGGRGRNPFFTMLARAFIQDEVDLTLAHLEYASGYPPPSRYYLFGFLFLNFLKERFGIEVFAKIRRRFLEYPIFGPWEAIRFVTGFSADELWRQMREELKKKLAPLDAINEAQDCTPQIIADYYACLPTIKGFLVYRQSLSQPTALVWYNPSSMTEQILVETYLVDEYSFAASQDGSQIVYAAVKYQGSNYDLAKAYADLYLVELAYDNSGRPNIKSSKALTTNQRLWQPAISPDKKHLIAIQGLGSYSRLVLVESLTGELSELFFQPQTNVYHPSFAPDGHAIVFCLNVNGRQGLVLLKAEDWGKKETYQLKVLINTDEFCCYYPYFKDSDTIIFTADINEQLAIYTYSLAQDKMALLVNDSVAAFASRVWEDKLIYTTYRSRGFALKQVELVKLAPRPIALPEVKVIQLTPLSPNPLNISIYKDNPKFQYWLPQLWYLNLANNYFIGVGAFADWETVLGTLAYQLSFLYYPSLQQVQFELGGRIQQGRWGINLQLSHDYSSFTSDGQEIYQEYFVLQPSLSLILLQDFFNSFSNTCYLFSGLNVYWLWQDLKPIPFLAGLGDPFIPSGMLSEFFTGMVFEHIYSGGAACFYPPWSLKSYLTALIPLPVSAIVEPGLALLLQASYSLPGIWPLSAIKLGLKSSLSFGSLEGINFFKPRGNFIPLETSFNQRLLVALDYQTTVFYIDAPLLAGLHLNGLGLGIFIEALANLDYCNQIYNLDPYLYTGIEITTLAGLGSWVLPLGIGVAIRIDYKSQVFTPAKDMAFYFFLSFDSFSAGLEKKASAIKAGWKLGNK